MNIHICAGEGSPLSGKTKRSDRRHLAHTATLPNSPPPTYNISSSPVVLSHEDHHTGLFGDASGRDA